MFDPLIAWDNRVFRLINEAWQHPILDALLPFMTDWRNFVVPLTVMALALLVWGGLQGRLFLLTAVVALLAGDAVSTYLFKHTIMRARPCLVLEGVRLLVGCASSGSFPSNHAVNATALVTLVVLYAPFLLVPAAAVALLIGYSRVYVGVHYPLDVLTGSLLGIVVAMTLCWAITSLVGRLQETLLRVGPRSSLRDHRR